MLQREIQVSLHQAIVGEAVEVLVDSKSRRCPDELSGRTTANTVVNFPGEPDWLGRTVTVKVERSGPNSLCGRVIGGVQGVQSDLTAPAEVLRV